MNTILIVDDNVDIAQLAAVVARLAGFEAVVCHSGTEALATLERANPSLVLLDNHMPGMTGMEVLKEIRRSRRPPPVAMYSADPNCFDEAMRQGAIGCVLKTRPDDLVPLLKQYC